MSFLIILRIFRIQKTHLWALPVGRNHGNMVSGAQSAHMLHDCSRIFRNTLLRPLRFLRYRKIFPSLLHSVEGAQAGGRHGAVFFENPGKVKFVFKTALIGNFTDPEM